MEFWRIWNILWRRKWVFVGAFAFFLIAVLLATHLIPPTYEAKAKMVARLPDPYLSMTAALEISTRSALGELANFDTVVGLAIVRPVLDNVIGKLDLKNRDGERLDVERFVKSTMARKIFPEPYVEAEQVTESGLLEITATSGDADEAAAICNTLVEQYIQYRLEERRKEYQEAQSLLKNRLSIAKSRYETALHDLTDFLKGIGKFDLAAEGTVLLNKITTLKASLEEDEQELVQLDKSDIGMRLAMQHMAEFRKETQEIGPHELMMQLKIRLAELMLDKSGLAISITRDHPEYQEVEARLETIGDLIKRQAETQLKSERYGIDPAYDSMRQRLISNAIDREIVKARMELSQRYLSGYQTELLKISDWSMTMTQKELQLKTMGNLYGELLAQAEEFELAHEMTPADCRLVHPAIAPKRAKFPKPYMNFLIGLVLGVFWGLAAAFFIEYIDIPCEQRLPTASRSRAVSPSGDA